jgi:RHS repeat-associated protein
MKFTGKERDAETGLDYFGVRYMSSAQGRFTSPDPAMSSAKLGDPQTWNRYAYVTNNPLRYIDSDGRDRLEAAQDAAVRDYLAGRITKQQLADRTIHTAPAGVGAVGAGAMVAATAVAALPEELVGAAALGLYNLATRFFNSPGGQETTKAVLDTMTGTPTPDSGEIGAARELAAAELLGGRLAGTAGQGLKLTVKGLGSTDIDVFGAAGEYVGVGGPKGLNLADFGRKLQILKTGAEQAGVEAQYVFSNGTPQKVIDFAKKRLGDSNVFVLPGQQ